MLFSESRLHINDFPDELLEKVFLCVEGQVLLVAQQVCQRWKFVIERLTEYGHIWEKCCRREIPAVEFTDLETRYCGEENDKWFTLYNNWQGWRHPDTLRVSQEYLLPEDCMACAKFSGKVTAYVYGYNRVWFCSDELGTFNSFYMYVAPVEDLTFMKRINMEKSPKGFQHKYVLVAYKYHLCLVKLEPDMINICTFSDVKCHAATNDLICIAQFGRVTLMRLNDENDESEVLANLLFSSVHHISIDHRRVFIFEEGTLRVFEPSEFQKAIAIPINFTKDIEVYSFGDGTVCYLDGVTFGVTVIDEPTDRISRELIFRTWNCMDTFGTLSSCLLFHAGIFVIGNDDGSLYLYNVDSHFTDFELSNYFIKITLDPYPVISLDIQEGKVPKLLATTMDDHVNVVTFRAEKL